ncbi:MAG: STAS domain-containing protein [Anaerolineales bacterium]|jgi:anti-anti-sigma factor
MEIIVSQENGKIPVGVIRVKGDLDASSYLDLVNTAQQLYDEGTRYLVLDLTDLSFISSAGLASLHMVAKLFRGERSDSKPGWADYKDINREHDSSMQKSIKLLNPSSDVNKVLDTVGFKQLFEVYMNLEEAIKSFQ